MAEAPAAPWSVDIDESRDDDAVRGVEDLLRFGQFAGGGDPGNPVSLDPDRGTGEIQTWRNEAGVADQQAHAVRRAELVNSRMTISGRQKSRA